MHVKNKTKISKLQFSAFFDPRRKFCQTLGHKFRQIDKIYQFSRARVKIDNFVNFDRAWVPNLINLLIFDHFGSFYALSVKMVKFGRAWAPNWSNQFDQKLIVFTRTYVNFGTHRAVHGGFPRAGATLLSFSLTDRWVLWFRNLSALDDFSLAIKNIFIFWSWSFINFFHL